MPQQLAAPTKKHRVYDLVEQVGHDMSDWHTSAKRCAVSANPKYCYEWSFTQTGKTSVLSLWWDMMEPEDGTTVHRHNFRPEHSGNMGQGSWIKRATKLDVAVRDAFRSGASLRVIVNDGRRRRADNARITRSTVDARMLDEAAWRVRSYDERTGDCVLERTCA
jgi:hypothetical protein